MLLSLHCPLQLGSQEESHRAQQGRQSGYTRVDISGVKPGPWGASVRTPSLSPLLWLKDHPQPLCPVLETLRGTALNARCRVKELTLALGTEARGKPAPGHMGRQKSLFAQIRSPKRSLHWTSAPAIDRSRVGQGGPSGPVPLRSC